MMNFDFNREAGDFEFGQDGNANVSGKFLDQFPASAVADLQEALGYRVINHGIPNGIGPGGGGEIRFQLQRQQQPLGMGAFCVGHTHMIIDFQIDDGDFRHGWWLVFFRPGQPHVAGDAGKRV